MNPKMPKLSCITELVERSRLGDIEAFENLVSRFQGKAYHTSYKILGDAQLAEDVMQEALLEASISLNDLREPQAFPRWFETIVVGKCDRIIRKRQSREAPLEVVTERAGEAPSLEEVIDIKRRVQTIWDAMNALTKDQRTVMILF